MAKDSKHEKSSSATHIRRVQINMNGEPSAFLKENQHLTSERMIEDGKLIAILPDDPIKAKYVVYLTWFDSPLRGFSDINKKIVTSAEYVGALNPNGLLINGWDVRAKEGGNMRKYMIRFLAYQQDFHHASFIKLELLHNAIFEAAMKDPANDKALKAYESLLSSINDVEAIRQSNYNCNDLMISIQHELETELSETPNISIASSTNKHEGNNKSGRTEWESTN
jgi:hypothetical protein